MSERVLVISPHPDDETLGAGGTLLKTKQRGGEIFWLNLTDMQAEYGYSADLVQRRQEEISAVRASFGFTGYFNLKLKPAGLDNYPRVELTQQLARVMQEVAPSTVILPYQNDVHSDHRIACEAGIACTKVFRFPTVRKVMMMEILSETDYAAPDRGFVPNCFVDITEFLDEKIGIMQIYRSELQDPPFPRSKQALQALATVRGAAAGCQYAEGFKIIKLIN